MPRLSEISLLNVPRFPVEEGHIMTFARAIGDPNPVYRDRDYACAHRTGGIIAPPTFVEAGIHHDPDFYFRPRLGEPWFGSGREPSGVVADEPATGTDFHAETTFEYHRALRPGDVLHASTAPGRTWSRDGRRAGHLTFREMVTEYRDENDQLVIRALNAAVSTDQKVDLTVATAASEQAPVELSPASWPTEYPVHPPRASELSVGQVHRCVVVDNLSRSQIVQYAGASGDFSPQHTDEVYNTRHAGYPSIFAHGMLSMGMLGRMLTDWLGDDRLLVFGVRFTAQVWPGDWIEASAEVTELTADEHGPVVSLRLRSRNQHDATVLSGHARARLDP